MWTIDELDFKRSVRRSAIVSVPIISEPSQKLSQLHNPTIILKFYGHHFITSIINFPYQYCIITAPQVFNVRIIYLEGDFITVSDTHS